jgi:hypothetical protein
VAATTNLLLPYPTLSDSDNVPRDIKALAEAIDAILFRPYIELEASAGTGTTANVAKKVDLATTLHTAGTAWFTVAGSVITVLQAGVYDIAGTSGFITGAGTRAIVLLNKNAGALTLASTDGTPSGSGAFWGSPSAPGVTLAANDTIQLDVLSQASATTGHQSSLKSRLMVRKVG